MARTYLLAMWCPVQRRRESHAGSRTELENLADDAKGKGTSGDPATPKVPMRRRGADCLVVAMKRGNARRAKGAGHRRWEGANRQREELQVPTEGGSLRSVARAG
jgi:hypothetical protein